MLPGLNLDTPDNYSDRIEDFPPPVEVTEEVLPYLPRGLAKVVPES
jgi:hypothetical protein